MDWQNELAEHLKASLEAELSDVWHQLTGADRELLAAVARRGALMQLDRLTGKNLYNDRDWQMFAASFAGVRAIGEQRSREVIRNVFTRGVRMILDLLK